MDREKIIRMAREAGGRIENIGQGEDHVLAHDILKFARAIERAHGIGGEE